MIVSEVDFQRLENQHIVQFYETDESVLAKNVVQYLGEGYRQGGGLLVVATEAHRHLFLAGLESSGIGVDAAIRTGRLTMLDADTTLRRFLRDGYPDEARFEATVGSAVRSGIERSEGRGFRVYGEMVALLWAASKCPAAIRLEQLWESLKRSLQFSLFCSYRIDIFSKEFEPGIVDALLCAHAQLLPTGRNERLASAISNAMAQVLAPTDLAKVVNSEKQPAQWADMPSGEAMILWLRKTMPERAHEILSIAREYYYVT